MGIIQRERDFTILTRSREIRRPRNGLDVGAQRHQCRRRGRRSGIRLDMTGILPSQKDCVQPWLFFNPAQEISNGVSRRPRTTCIWHCRAGRNTLFCSLTPKCTHWTQTHVRLSSRCIQPRIVGPLSGVIERTKGFDRTFDCCSVNIKMGNKPSPGMQCRAYAPLQ